MKMTKKSASGHNWTLGTLLVIPPILTLFFTNLSTYQPLYETDTNKYIYENLGVVFLSLFILLTILMSFRHRFVYWPFLSKHDRESMDERQLIVRNRVYERSYKMMAIAITLALYGLNLNDNVMRQMFVWTFVCGYFAMPLIVAARQKDS